MRGSWRVPACWVTHIGRCASFPVWVQAQWHVGALLFTCFALAATLRKSTDEDNKKLVATDLSRWWAGSLCTTTTRHTWSLALCSYEEADTHILLHVAHAAQHGHNGCFYILAVMVVQTLQAEDEVWLAFGTGKSFRYLHSSQQNSSLSGSREVTCPYNVSCTNWTWYFINFCWTLKEKCMGCLEFPARTDWSITETGMCTHWDTRTQHPGHWEIWRTTHVRPNKHLQWCEQNCRKKLFAKKSFVQRIPPTRAALEQHVERDVFQGGHIWGQTLIPQPVLPSPSS